MFPFLRSLVQDSVTSAENLTLTAPFNNVQTKSSFTTVNQLLPASNYYWVCDNEIVVLSSDNATVHGSSRKLGGAAEYLIGSSKKKNNFVGRALNFRVHVLLKGAVSNETLITMTIKNTVHFSWCALSFGIPFKPWNKGDGSGRNPYV